VWGVLPYNSYSLGITPLVYDGKLYMPLERGLHVYDANTGKLLGVDTALYGSGSNGTIFQYNNLMILPDSRNDNGIFSYIAIDLNG
jgi:hypothetical protein